MIIFNIDVCWLYFDRFCDFTVRQLKKENPGSPLIRIMQDPYRALKMCDPSYFKTYLFWRVKYSRIKKESSIITRWKILSMVYARLAEEYMKESVLYDMRNVLCLSLYHRQLLYSLRDSGSRKFWRRHSASTTRKKKSRGFLSRIYADSRMPIGCAIQRYLLMSGWGSSYHPS